MCLFSSPLQSVQSSREKRREDKSGNEMEIDSMTNREYISHIRNMEDAVMQIWKNVSS